MSFCGCLFLTSSPSYGHTVKDDKDPFVRLVEAASASTSEAAVPDAFLVDRLPSRKHVALFALFVSRTYCLVKYVPEWMPGAGFKRKAREWRKLSQDMINKPYEMVKGKFVRGLYVVGVKLPLILLARPAVSPNHVSLPPVWNKTMPVFRLAKARFSPRNLSKIPPR